MPNSKDYGSKCKRTKNGEWFIRTGRHVDRNNHKHESQWFVIPREVIKKIPPFDSLDKAIRYLVEVLGIDQSEIIDDN